MACNAFTRNGEESMTWSMARPNKLMDAAKLEQWVPVHILTEWEFNDCVEYIDFWDWLDLEHSDMLERFESWYKCMERDQ